MATEGGSASGETQTSQLCVTDNILVGAVHPRMPPAAQHPGSWTGMAVTHVRGLSISKA